MEHHFTIHDRVYVLTPINAITYVQLNGVTTMDVLQINFGGMTNTELLAHTCRHVLSR